MPRDIKIPSFLKTSVSLFISSLCFATTVAQTEYLVKVDPETGVYTKIDSIPGVMYIYMFNYSVFDERDHNYIFYGTYDQVNDYLFTIDAVTGKIVSKAPFPQFADHSALQNFIYANSIKTLYGFYTTNGSQFLASIDPAIGNYSLIKQLTGLSSINESVFCNAKQQMIFAGVDTAGNSVIGTLDVSTGNVLSIKPVPYIQDIQYNNKLGQLYCLYRPPGGWYIGSIDTATGTVKILNALGSIEGIYQGETTFDEINNRYIISASDTNSVSYLYTADAATGNVIYKVPALETSNVGQDNIIQYRFDNVSGNLYALHWEAHTKRNTDSTGTAGTSSTRPFVVYPNPVTGNGRIFLDTLYSEVVFMVYDALGRLVRTQKSSNASFIDISRGNLASAIYFYRIANNRKTLATGKIIFE